MRRAGMRMYLVVAAAVFLEIGLGTALAQSPPEQTAPTPGPDEIVFVGTMPTAPGATATVRVIDLDTGLLSDCVTAPTFALAGDSPNTSHFEVLVPATCLQEAEGVMICWSAAPEDCAVVAAPAGLSLGVPAIAELLGQTVDLGLLSPRAITVPAVPPEADVVAPGEVALPPTGSVESRPGQYDWLLWAGVATLAAGLAFGGAAFALRQRRRALERPRAEWPGSSRPPTTAQSHHQAS